MLAEGELHHDPFGHHHDGGGEGSEDEADMWETSKENVKPIVRGRSVAKLISALKER